MFSNSLLPGKKESIYNLRQRRHNRSLAINIITITECDFIVTRLLLKYTYCQPHLNVVCFTRCVYFE